MLPIINFASMHTIQVSFSFFVRVLFFPFIMGVFSLAITGCDQNEEISAEKEKEIVEKGNGISQQLGGTLMARLTDQIHKNGVVNALEYCSVVAIPLTDSISARESVNISRISHKPRNPQNSASQAETELIQQYISQMENNEDWGPIVKPSGQGYVYYSPIILGIPACLNCHGSVNENIEPEVMSAIHRLYPDDQSTGFELGHVRGLFKIEVDNDPGP